MGNAGWGAGAAAAGFAKALSGAISANRAEERQETRRQEARETQIEHSKLQTVLPQILANPDLVNSDALATEFPTIFGKGAKDGKGRLSQLQTHMGGLAPLLQQGGFSSAPRGDPAASSSSVDATILGGGHEATSGIPTVSGRGNEANPVHNRAAGDIGPVATLFGAPVLSAGQQLQRDEQAGNQLDAATLRRRQTHVQALANAGQPLQGAALQEYLTTGKLTLPRQTLRTPTVTPAGQFEKYLADKQTEAQAAGKPWTTEDTLAARREWELANDPAAKAGVAKAGATGSPEILAYADMVADNPSQLQGVTPTMQGAVMGAIASNPQLRQRYETARMAPVRNEARKTLDAMQDLVQVDAQGIVTGLTPGAASLYGMNVLNRAMSHIPGSPGATARTALNMVTGQQVLDLLAEMKKQSKTGATGFGQLSTRELGVMESAATMLKGEIAPDRAQALLADIYDKLRKILAPPLAMPNAGAPDGTPPPAGATPAASQPGGGAGVPMPGGGAPRATKGPTGWILNLP